MRTNATIGVCFVLLSLSQAVLGLDSGSMESSGEAENFAVIRLKDHDGVVRYEAIPKADVKERREDVTLAYEAAMKVYRLKKKGTREGGISVFLKKPNQPRMSVLGTGFTKEKASARADKLQRDHEKGRKKSGLGLFSGK